MNDLLPARRDYKPEVLTTPMSELPFVSRPERKDKKARHSNWNVPAAEDYGVACEIGREYAAHYIQYLKDNPGQMPILNCIVSDIDFEDKSNTKGYWVGFISYLDRLLRAQARQLDVFADVDREQAIYARLAANAKGESS